MCNMRNMRNANASCSSKIFKNQKITSSEK